MVYNSSMTTKTEQMYVTSEVIECERHVDTYIIPPEDSLVFTITDVGYPFEHYRHGRMVGQPPDGIVGSFAEVAIQKIIHRWTNDIDNVSDRFEIYGTWLEGNITEDETKLEKNANDDSYELLNFGIDFNLLIADYYGLLRD